MSDFDFDDLVPGSAPVWFNLVDPKTDDDAMRNGKPVRLLLMGPDNPEMVAFEAAMQNKRTARAGNNLRKLTAALDAETLEREATARAAKILVGWENLARRGKELNYSPEAAKELVVASRPLRDFILLKYGERGNFLGTAETTPTK